MSCVSEITIPTGAWHLNPFPLSDLSGFHAHDALRTEQWDSLEKVLTVFLPPPSAAGRKRVHRRVDLIFAVPEAYYTAVIGW